jgi:two-component system phosphate regulon sensor histidine kinase PhoR
MIKRMSLRKKIALLLTVSVTVMALLTWIIVYRLERRDLIAENSESLAQSMRLFAEGGEKEGISEARRLFHYWKKIYPDGRLTIIASTGEIIYDSSADPTSMDNHYGRKEIAGAFDQGEGHDVRYSRTLGTWYNYIARKITVPDGEEVVVRLSYPVERLATLARSMGKSFAIALLASLVIIWLMSYIMLSVIMKPLTLLSKAARSISAGEPARFPLTAGSEEIRTLSSTLNSMYDSLQENIEREERSKNELAALIEALPIGIIFADRYNKIRYINGTACELCGCGGNVAAGSAAEVILPSAAITAMLKGADETKLVKLQRKGGQLSLSVSAIGLESGRIIVIEDLTEKIKLEEARRDFFVDAGHEFQTPLSIIRMGLELLKSDKRLKGDEDQDTVDRLIKQQERITGLVDDLLLLVKLDLDPLKENLEETDLRELIDEAVSEARELPAAEALSVEEGELAEEGEAIITVRRADVKRALFNLIENGVKYVSSLGEEGGKVEVSLFKEGGFWKVRVDDNGPGVTASDKDAIFDRFRRGEGHRARAKHAAGGYGLGLSIARRIAERHGGSLLLLPEPKLGGASFELSLPEEKR